MTRYIFLDTETTGLHDTADVWEIGCIVREIAQPGTVVEVSTPEYDAQVPGDWQRPDVEYHWMVLPDLSTADPNGLRIGRFYERIPDPGPLHLTPADVYNLAEQYTDDDVAEGEIPPHRIGKLRYNTPRWSSPVGVAAKLARILSGAVVFGAVPNFDEKHLTRWLRKHGQTWCANYHLVDIEAVLSGFLLGQAAAYGAEWNGQLADEHAGWLRTEAAPPWRSVDLYRRLGYHQDPDEKHTALGDAIAVRDMWDLMHGTMTVNRSEEND